MLSQSHRIMNYMTGRSVLVQDISGSMANGDGTVSQIFMYMSTDIGQDKKPAAHMKQVIGKADHVVNSGSEVAGTEKAVNMIVAITEGKCVLNRIIGCNSTRKLIFFKNRSCNPHPEKQSESVGDCSRSHSFSVPRTDESCNQL